MNCAFDALRVAPSSFRRGAVRRERAARPRRNELAARHCRCLTLSFRWYLHQGSVGEQWGFLPFRVGQASSASHCELNGTLIADSMLCPGDSVSIGVRGNRHMYDKQVVHEPDFWGCPDRGDLHERVSGTGRAGARQERARRRRVSIIQGSAVVQRGDSNTQSPRCATRRCSRATTFRPAQTSRAELQFDGYTAVRLGGNVQARITNNDPNNRRMQLADGTIEVGVVRDAQPIDIDTPSVTVRAQEAGDYRITIGRDGSSWVTARRGTVEVVTPQRTYTLTRAGRSSRADRLRIRRSPIRLRSHSTRSTISTPSATRRWSPHSTQART